MRHGARASHVSRPLKCYIHQLSEESNNLPGVEVPELNSVQVTHLLWADDLVMLALDPESLQIMLNVLLTYCGEWGLAVNTDKTAVMVFNRSGRQLKDSLTFKFGDTEIPSAREYCYLGVSFSLHGTLRPAQAQLRQKGLRSYFALKRMLDLRELRKSVFFRLFDALISYHPCGSLW